MWTTWGRTQAQWTEHFRTNPWPEAEADMQAKAEARVAARFRWNASSRSHKRKVRKLARQGKRKHTKKETWLVKDTSVFDSKWTK